VPAITAAAGAAVRPEAAGAVAGSAEEAAGEEVAVAAEEEEEEEVAVAAAAEEVEVEVEVGVEGAVRSSGSQSFREWRPVASSSSHRASRSEPRLHPRG
jgi:hypothetical protein